MTRLLLYIVIISSLPLSWAKGDELQTGTFRAVVAGVTHYRGELLKGTTLKLNVAAKKMEVAIRNLALKRGFTNKSIDIKVLVGGENAEDEPTRERFFQAVADMSINSIKGDMMVVYFTGHATETYFLGSGASLNDNFRKIEFEKFKELITDSEATIKLVFLDVCQVFDVNISLGTSPGFKGSLESRPREVWVYSSDLGQPSYIDKQLGFGYFTKHLLEALKNQNADGWTENHGNTGGKDGGISTDELNAYLYRNVRKDVSAAYGARQNPWISSRGTFYIDLKPKNDHKETRRIPCLYPLTDESPIACLF